MKAKKLRSYKKPGKNPGDPAITVFVYSVSGSKEQLEKFKTAQGDFHRVDEDGTPLWFTTRFAGDNAKLIITDRGVIADMSEFDAAASLADQFGGNLGQELARAAANKLMGTHTEEVSAPVTKPTE